MKLKILAGLFAAMLVWTAGNTARATHILTNGFVVLNITNSGSTFYDTDSPTGNPDFTNTVATINQGQSIRIGGEVSTSPCCGNIEGAESAAILFSIDGGPFQTNSLPFTSQNGSLDKWQQQNPANMSEIGTSLTVGTHTLAVRFMATDSNHPVAPHPAYLPSISSSYSAQIEVLAPVPTPDGADDACGADYINDGWQTGDGAFGTTFGGWTLTGTSGSSSDNGFFVGSSTNNASGAVGGIDCIFDPGPPGGPTTNVAWGIYANNGNTAVAYRPFAGSLAPGQEFEIATDNGDIQSGGYVGFVLRNGNITTNKNAGQRFEFLFAGGESTYKYIDKDGVHDTGVGFTGGGLAARVVLTSLDTYILRVLAFASVTNFSGRLGGAAGAGIESMALYNQNAGSGGTHDAFFNKLLVTTGVVPEPRITAIEVRGGTNALIDCQGVPGALHEVQERDDLDAGSWATLTNNMTTTTGSLEVNDWFAPSQPRRFYQLKVTE